MKEIKNIDPIYIEKFDITVNPYLSYSQIQQIVNAVIKFDSWAERQQNIDILVLYHATNISKENIELYSHDQWLQSGVISSVKSNIVNYNKIEEAIQYTESTQRALSQIIQKFPELASNLKRVKKHEATS